MIDAAWIPSLTGLCGVALGSGFTWFIQRNEWGRQRRWELRRDANLDAIRGLADLEESVINLNTAFSKPPGTLTDEARNWQENLRLDAAQRFQKSSSAYKRAQVVVDLAVGGELSTELSRYFQFALPLVRDGLRNQNPFLDSADKRKHLALRGNAVVISARAALGIRDAGELPLPDHSS